MIKNISIDNIKFQNISKDDLILALDRLTRFKYPEAKLYRVFSDLLCKYLLCPKLSKNEIKYLDIGILCNLIESIWNTSVKTHFGKSLVKETFLKDILVSETFSTYNLSDDVKKMVSADLIITPIINYLHNIDDLPINLKRLIYLLGNDCDSVCLRDKYALRFPVEKVVLCEGITEEILLPKFAKLSGYDFDKNGVKLIGAGGKNQVAKLYCELKDELKIPIFVLLDADAKPTSDLISFKLRSFDKVYLIESGEFEDIFSLNLIKRTINNVFKNICECGIADFKSEEPMTRVLSEFYRKNELGDFQKADFAKALASNLKYHSDLTPELLKIIDEIKNI